MLFGSSAFWNWSSAAIDTPDDTEQAAQGWHTPLGEIESTRGSAGAAEVAGLDGTLARVAVRRTQAAGGMAEDLAKDAPSTHGFELCDALHSSGDGSLFSVSHSLLSREAGSRWFR